MRARLARYLPALWYGGSPLYRLLLPLSWLYCLVVGLRRVAYRAGVLRRTTLDCPVVVVGNLVVGGSGKTPLVIALADALTQAGWRVGILCSGYRGRANHRPQAVTPDSDPVSVGDEAVLLAQRTRRPVMAGRDRVAAAQALLRTSDCDLLLCDDGLQHYALERDIEIAVIDAARPHGNGACLPAGPLREPWRRLQTMDAVVALGAPCADAGSVMRYTSKVAVNLGDPQQQRPLQAFGTQRVHAVAGTAHPQRFFDQLRRADLQFEAHAFEDHRAFRREDFAFATPGPVLMTEKDAVKCRRLPLQDAWYVPLEVDLDPALTDWLSGALTQEL